MLSLHAEGNEKRIRFFNWFFQCFALLMILVYERALSALGDAPSYVEGLSVFGVLPLLVVGILCLIARIFQQKESKTWVLWVDLLYSIAFGVLAGVVVW